MSLPKIKDTVFKICPKCNPSHQGTCKNCAWGSALFSGACDVGNRIYPDGSGEERGRKNTLQVVEVIVRNNTIADIYDMWNTMYFPTAEEAQAAITEFKEICMIDDREKRFQEYISWHKRRKPVNPLRG